METDAVRVIGAGTLLWSLGVLALAPFYRPLAAAGHGWWVWTCLAGVLLGLVGLGYCRLQAATRRH